MHNCTFNLHVQYTLLMGGLELFNQYKLIRGQMRNSSKALLRLVLQHKDEKQVTGAFVYSEDSRLIP